MKRWPVILPLLSLLCFSGCAPTQDEPAAAAQAGEAPAADPAPAPAPASVPGFVNKVWKVSGSQQVAAGDLRIFLSDGTLVMASDRARPALGRWSIAAGRLTITEEGIDYPTDILETTADTLRLRMHSPGDPLELQMSRVDGAAAVAPPGPMSGRK